MNPRPTPPPLAGEPGALRARSSARGAALLASSLSEVRLACPDCALVQRLPHLKGRESAECRRCARTLAGPASGRCTAPLALLLAAFILLVPALLAPVLRIFAYGPRAVGVIGGAESLWAQGYGGLGTIVAVCGVFMPCLLLILLIYILASLQLGAREGLGSVFRWASHLRPWVMLEVYLLGAFVAYSRVKVLTPVAIGTGGWCLLAATLLLMLALTQLDERTVWDSLPWTPQRSGTQRIACTVCDLLVENTHEGGRCPRCHAVLHRRKHHSLVRTTALLTAGYLLYVPANVLPVLRLSYLGGQESNTLYSGVLELARSGEWPLALIVLLASIVIPLLKLWGLTWMLLSTHRRSGRLLRARTRLYRAIELIGRWSNIDVFMASLLVSLLGTSALTQVHVQPGLSAFAAVVILTMLATESFDPRLMWDAAEARA